MSEKSALFPDALDSINNDNSTACIFVMPCRLERYVMNLSACSKNIVFSLESSAKVTMLLMADNIVSSCPSSMKSGCNFISVCSCIFSLRSGFLMFFPIVIITPLSKYPWRILGFLGAKVRLKCYNDLGIIGITDFLFIKIVFATISESSSCYLAIYLHHLS